MLLYHSIKFFIFINSDALDSVVGNVWLSPHEEEVHWRACACVCEEMDTHWLMELLAGKRFWSLVIVFQGGGGRCDSWNTQAAASPFTQVIRTRHQRGIENIRLKKGDFRSSGCPHTDAHKDPSSLSSDGPKHSYPFLSK